MNSDIKDAIRKAGLKQWMVADQCNVSEYTFVKWLRHELPEERKQRIYQALDELKAQRGGEVSV